METKFTKGEWINIHGIIVPKDNIQHFIANTYANSFGKDEHKANTSLIIAAPNMFNALLSIHENSEIWNNLPQCHRDEIKKAIKKATNSLYL
jgi:hypothetical protein